FSSNPEQKGLKSEKQRLHRERFKRAVAYARLSLQDPETKAAYAAKALSSRVDFLNSFSLAVKDFLKTPTVDAVDHAAYGGQIGDVIRLKVFDEFKVAEVRVSIKLPTGVVLESGLATPIVGSADWQYEATVVNATVIGSTISVVVTDKPGNSTTFEQII